MRDADGSGRAAEIPSDRAGATVPRAGRGRMSPADLLAFRRALDAATRRAVVTPLIVLACSAWFAAITAAGVPLLWPAASQLVSWGANDGGRLILRHDYWRLGASVFVHGGLIHLVMNMLSLLMIGPLVERIYGHLAFTALYLAAGIGGAIASAAVPPLRVSVGASGAICGVLGGLLAFLVAHYRAIPPTVLRRLSLNVLGVVVVMAVLGVAVPDIDQAAHLGGLAVGVVVGLLLIGPWPVVPGRRRWLLARRIALTGAIAAALAGTAVAVARRGDSAISADRRFDDLIEQIAPIVREFDSIRRDLARSVGRLDRREGSADLPAINPAVRALRARAEANRRRMGAVRAFHREVWAIQGSLIRALAEQVRWLDAIEDDFASSDREFMEAARQALAAMAQGIKDCTEDRRRYMERHGLQPQLTPSPPTP
jgi:rhomboid protease GluP